MNIEIVTLDRQRIAFRINFYTNVPGNALQVFTVGAEKEIRDLEVIIDDLFDKFLSLFLQIWIITRVTCCLKIDRLLTIHRQNREVKPPSVP